MAARSVVVLPAPAGPTTKHEPVVAGDRCGDVGLEDVEVFGLRRSATVGVRRPARRAPRRR